MSGNEVIVQMTAQDAELVAAWQRARKGPQGMEEELGKVGKAGKKAGKDIKDAFDSTIPSVGELAVAATGVGSVMIGIQKVGQLISAEWNDILARMKEAAGIQIDIAGSQRKAFESLGTKSDISRGELAGLVQRESKIPLASAYKAVAAALKEGNEATGFSARRAAETGLEAGRLAPGIDDAEREALASAAVELQQGDGNLTPAQAVAQVRRFQRKSESSGLQVNKSLTAGIGHIQEMAPGTSAGDADGFILGIQKQANLGDTGQAATLAEKFLVGMNKAGANGTLNEQLASLQGGNKKFQAAALKAVSKSPEAFATFQQLSQPGSAALQSISALQGQLGGSAEQILGEERAFASAVGSEPGQLTANAARNLQTSKEKNAVAKTEAGLQIQARERAVQAYKDAGYGPTGRQLLETGSQLGGIFQTPEQNVRSLATTLEQTTQSNALSAEMIQTLRDAKDEIIRMADDIKRLAEQKDKPQRVVVAGREDASQPTRATAGQLSQ